jgi:hypothetical protein
MGEVRSFPVALQRTRRFRESVHVPHHVVTRFPWRRIFPIFILILR